MKAISESQLWKKRLGDWVLNPYVGCEHGCFHCYCPAMPGVKFFNHGHTQEEWGKYIYPKEGFVDALKQQLRTFTPDKAKRTEWGDGWVLMSFLTDCYTPIEAKQKITRECLRLLLEAGHKVRVQTRSALIERDFDILAAHRDRVLVGTSLPYLDDPLARALEPRASSPKRRLQMLHNAVAADLQVYVAIAPFMPWNTVADLVKVFRRVRILSPREIFCEVLNPKGDNLQMMMQALEQAEVRTQLPFGPERVALAKYNEVEWSLQTHAILWCGANYDRERFVPWPDTGRSWAKHLAPDQVSWLDQFLPPR